LVAGADDPVFVAEYDDLDPVAQAEFGEDALDSSHLGFLDRPAKVADVLEREQRS
jgi:hypothetical protein